MQGKMSGAGCRFQHTALVQFKANFTPLHAKQKLLKLSQ